MIKINQNIKARQKSEIAIIVFFEGGVNRGGRYEWHPKTHGSLWSEPFRTKELSCYAF